MKKKDLLYPLRKLHGKIYELRKTIKKKIRFSLYLLFPVGRKVLIPGTPEHQNIGDSAIVIAQKNFLERCGVPQKRIKEISFSECKQYSKILQKLITAKVIITHLGGGNMGDQWLEEENLHRKLISDFPNNIQIIFPQTIYYTPTRQGQEEKKKSQKYYNGRNNLILISREQKSYKVMQSIYSDTPALLAPDIVLSTTKDVFGVGIHQRKDILLCFRNDAEKMLTHNEHIYIKSYLERNGYTFRVTDMYSGCTISKGNRTVCVKYKMEEFASAKLVITDRLHGMIFAAITGTPCIVFGNYNYKVKGTYDWISYLPYICFLDTTNEIESVFEKLLNMGNCEYSNEPLFPYFKKLECVVNRIYTKSD